MRMWNRVWAFRGDMFVTLDRDDEYQSPDEGLGKLVVERCQALAVWDETHTGDINKAIRMAGKSIPVLDLGPLINNGKNSNLRR